MRTPCPWRDGAFFWPGRGEGDCRAGAGFWDDLIVIRLPWFLMAFRVALGALCMQRIAGGLFKWSRTCAHAAGLDRGDDFVKVRAGRVLMRFRCAGIRFWKKRTGTNSGEGQASALVPERNDLQGRGLWRAGFSPEAMLLILLAWREGLLSGAIKQKLRAWMI